MKKLILALFLLSISNVTVAKINAKLMQYMDVSDTHIVFVYGGDVWTVDKNGGTAIQVTNSPGQETWPRFSPDGKEIAFSARYNGNVDVYVMPISGGMPNRVTYRSHSDRMIDWHPDGNKIMFASRSDMGQRSSRQFFLVDKEGGFPERVNIPYGELATFSPNGESIAYITKITENYPFKRYRGGLSSDVIIYDSKSGKFENITNNTAIDGKPAWSGNHVYFLSDQGSNMRLNIYKYNVDTKETKQVTNYKEFDISFLSAGGGDLVFENGGDLYLLNTENEEITKVEVDVISDLSLEMARKVNVSDSINNMTASPDTKRIIFEARGELFNVPAKDGYTINMTSSSGAFDHNPSWSPDGKLVAYWSDKNGEYNIYLADTQDITASKALTKRTKGFGYKLFWSPNSEHIAFIDETNTIQSVEVKSGKTTKIAHTDWNVAHPGRIGYPINWSPDSNYLVYHKGLDNSNFAIFLYSFENKTNTQLTSGFFSDFYPVFSEDAKYLYFLTDRALSSVYSDFDNTWVYPNSTQIAAVSLTPDIASPIPVKSDEYVPKEPDTSEDKKDDEKSDDDRDVVITEIDFEGFESRVTILPVSAGNMGMLNVIDGKLTYIRYPNSGAAGGQPSLKLFDMEEREEKTIIDNVQQVAPNADSKKLLVSVKNSFGIVKPEKDQKIKDQIPVDSLVMNLVPKQEWRQIFSDTWRRHRDFFYDPNMHKVDWDELKEQYGELINDARSRWDVSNIQSNLAAELSAGHTYTFGGDIENVEFVSTGFLGIDWEKSKDLYRIERIVTPATWETATRSPFDRPGVDVDVGDYVHSVNGIKLDVNKDPYSVFEGLGNKTISLMVSKNGKVADAKKIVVEALDQNGEDRLRYLEWMEQKRLLVDELSDGKLGYVYMSNTSVQGQRELVSMYYGQLNKQGFIIDERFNGGGQLSDRFLELLQRPVVYHLHWRHGRDHQWPIHANTGPMGMLINGWAGSGGDALPWAFQELEAGPIVGERTLGILVGPATGHQLIDGGGITVPGARLYDNDGHWFWEGEGVAPDIPVWDDPNIIAEGRDPQMERVVDEVLKLLKDNPPMKVDAPAYENRTAKGFRN